MVRCQAEHVYMHDVSGASYTMRSSCINHVILIVFLQGVCCCSSGSIVPFVCCGSMVGQVASHGDKASQGDDLPITFMHSMHIGQFALTYLDYPLDVCDTNTLTMHVRACLPAPQAYQ
jgi:hypothetical protein